MFVGKATLVATPGLVGITLPWNLKNLVDLPTVTC